MEAETIRNKTKWLALFALGLLGAFFNPAVTCAQEVAEVAAEMEDDEEEKKVIKVPITNPNLQHLLVYVVGGPIGSPTTSRVSLGTVYAQGSKLFKLRESFVSRGGGQFRILVRPVGGHKFLASEYIIIDKSGTVEWTLNRPLASGGYISVTR